MKYLVELLFTCCLVALVSCESELTTSSNSPLEKKLILNPTRFEGEQFALCTLKAKVTNVPNSDVHFFWDIDEGEGFQQRYSIITPIFYENRAHNVRVKAFDSFTDELLGFDSLRVDIRPPIATTKMTPEVIDTTVITALSGRLFYESYFFVQTTSPLHLVDLVADFGDGSNEVTVTTGDGHLYHLYEETGTFQVIVKAYEKTGRYLGTDTSVVKIRLAPVTRSMLITAKQVSALLLIDSAHSVFSHPMFQNPLAVRIPFQNTVDTIKTVNVDFRQMTFSAAYDLHYTGYQMSLDSIAGEFSEDFYTLQKLFVSVNDVRPNNPNKGTLVYSFEAKDLELFAITGTAIIYMTKAPRPTFLTQLQFESTVKNYPAGNSGMVSAIVPTTVCAMIVFER